MTFEQSGYALTDAGNGKLTVTKASTGHQSKSHRFLLHQADANVNQYTISSALDDKYISSSSSLVASKSTAAVFTISDLANGNGYALSVGGKSWSFGDGQVKEQNGVSGGIEIFSVTYS